MTYTRKEVIGDCELYLGDCLEVMPTLAKNSYTLLWTDPPYGHNNADGDLLSVVNSGKLQRRAALDGAKPIHNDDMDSMKTVVDGMLTQAVELLNENSSCCCCCCCGGGGPKPTFAWLANRMDQDGLSFFHSIIWDKKNPGLGWRYKRQHEMIMVAHRKGGTLSWAEKSDPIGNVFKGFLPGQQRQHPNEKPLWLVRGFVERHTERGENVLDPFMGGGTTGVACAKMGRKFTGIELDEDYFNIACERISKAYEQPDLFVEAPKKPVQDVLI
jgi:site-specific DNA-methyltransferase (adenine-specific)